MGVLIDRLNKQIADQRAERIRIVEQAEANLAEVDGKLKALEAAGKVITKDVEENYEKLLRLGLVSDIAPR